jgi:hypothetical protein
LVVRVRALVSHLSVQSGDLLLLARSTSRAPLLGRETSLASRQSVSRSLRETFGSLEFLVTGRGEVDYAEVDTDLSAGRG